MSPPPSPDLAGPADLAQRLDRLEAENARLRVALAQAEGHEATLERVRSALAERERDLRSILDHMPSMIGYWDCQLRNRFGNHAYHAWFGCDPASMPGKHIREVIGEERYRLNLPYIEGALRGEPQTFERAIPGPDGRVRHSLAHYLPDVVDGQVRGFYVLVNDVTALKQAEEALRASEERYRAVVEDQTEVISRLREDGTFTFVNDVYCRFFAKPADELIGKKWMPVCHPDDLPRVRERLATLSPENPVVVVENRVYSGTSRLHWMQFVNRGFFDRDGRLMEIQSVGRDITDRKNAERALLEAQERLEQRVLERTEALRRLAVEATLAEERERQAIARDLHDELGQLLHVVRIKLDDLARHLPETHLAAAGAVVELVSDASRLVRSLTSQLSPPVLKSLGLAAALRWLVEEMQRQYGLEVVFRQTSDEPLPLGPAASAILFRAARELLINVARHAGTDQASLGLIREEDSLILMVADRGVGLARTAGAGGDEGFGLASVRERLLFLGGGVEVASPPDGGLRVTLRLPLGAGIEEGRGDAP